jgi:predicted SAM-dependent methyltransferase
MQDIMGHKLNSLPLELRVEVNAFIDYLLAVRSGLQDRQESEDRPVTLADQREFILEIRHLTNTFKHSKLLPPYLLKQVRFELYAAANHFKSALTGKQDWGGCDLKLNIGCWRNGKAGWVNIDIVENSNVNLVWDCRKKLPFENGTVKMIFAEHFLEHLDYREEALPFLCETRRVLAEKGVLRIIVPDLEKYLKAYNDENSWEKLIEIRPLTGERMDFWTKRLWNTRMELINELFRQSYEHKAGYDFETMRYLLDQAGYSEIYRQQYMKSLVPELALDMKERASESLYVEAIK